MKSEFDDQVLAKDIDRLQAEIRIWAKRHGVWIDCGFKTYLEHVDGEPPETPVVCIMYFGSSFSDSVLCGYLEEEFCTLIDSHGFYYENADGCTLHLYPEDGPRCVAYAEYFNWEWVCSLVQADFADVYEELYSHFARRPDDLHRLSWREFEILLARTFQAQGFMTELGPGRGDGGVDIRLLQRDPIGDILTLVQAKKYAPKNKIGLEAVAALSGIAGVERAQRSLFVTTSSYQPAAKKFAARTSGALQLYTSSDVAEWCKTARDGIVKDKSSLVSSHSVERLLSDVRGRLDSRVLHASGGHTMLLNTFVLVLKETKNAALLMSLPRHVVSHDGYGQRGTEIPSLDASAARLLTRDAVWRAKRATDDSGRVRYWDGKRGYSAWNGKPADFDYCD
ncbi:MAG TPA: restriction endonuclease [Casimicrobium sp.]|nr:restriction endonuclease [Hyphomonadaceae bacterium]HPG61850.1 restriction endonuclease [Casimicrobium sp.]